MKKKSILTMALSLALVGSISVGATLAYLSFQTDPAVNTFTVGQVQISQAETGDWTTNPLVPGVGVSKSPTVTVAKSSEPCYVYMRVEYGDKLKDLVTLDINSNWTPLDQTVYPGVYKYTSVVPKNTAAATQLDSLFTTVTANATDTNEQLTVDGLVKTITVTSFAIQANGLTGSPDDQLPGTWKVTPAPAPAVPQA